MHPMEYKKEKVGTGRFTHLILKNSCIIVDVGFDHNQELQNLLRDPDYVTYVLYPGEDSINLSATLVDPPLPERPKQFIVIDGTWPCAKKMMKLTTTLHHLPRVSFERSNPSEFKVKHQPLPQCLSTVESIYQVLMELNRLGQEETAVQQENLMAVFHHTVERQMQLAQDPAHPGYRKKPFSLPQERKISKKWEKRLLFFRSAD